MAMRILIPTPLRQYTENSDAVEVEGATVDELLRALMDLYPALKKHLYTEEGKLRSFVNIYVNDEDIRYLEYGATKVTEKDVVSIIPSIAGGFQDREWRR